MGNDIKTKSSGKTCENKETAYDGQHSKCLLLIYN